MNVENTREAFYANVLLAERKFGELNPNWLVQKLEMFIVVEAVPIL